MVAPETPLGPPHSTPPTALDKPSLGAPPLLRLTAYTLASKADRNAQEPSEMDRNAQELLTPTLPSEANFTLFLMKGRQENPGASGGQPHTHLLPLPQKGLQPEWDPLAGHLWNRKRVSALCLEVKARTPALLFPGPALNTPWEAQSFLNPPILAALYSPGGVKTQNSVLLGKRDGHLGGDFREPWRGPWGCRDMGVWRIWVWRLVLRHTLSPQANVYFWAYILT